MHLPPSARAASDARWQTGASAKAASGSEFSFTVKPLPGQGIMEMFSRLAVALKDADTTPAKLMVFGSLSARPAADEAMRRVFGRIDWPVTWVEGAAGNDHPIAGMQAFAFDAGRVNPITLNGRVVGSVFEEGAMRHCLLGGLGPGQRSTSRPDQLRQTLENLEAALELAGFSLPDVVRTWFYVDQILSWYGAFNKVRTQVYSRVQFRSGSLPASTGISGRNPAGSALVAGAWALQPLEASARVAEVASPLQCPAPAYGSSFSRAMEISAPRGRRLLISGTASVAPGGETLWTGNVRRQIDLTMNVVEAILASRGFGFRDITRATAYVKNRDDMPAFAVWCAARDLRSLPAIVAHCGICREDLLFELEADAWTAAPAS
jgi:enamine deaminase RidA (YjgF/YER057c/UK114 family)